ncbi:tRNA (guanine-N(7)-)-methyltransferase non-catalytic subunit trm82 [Tulasnella sp. 419]|nr:tRNA (guanine-N(7)-)-methyltransferase non-catalytic subunit trm82 [Tulasnella sp. 419]
MSRGGDHELCIWDWKSGRLLHRYPVYEVAEPFIKVRGGRRGFRRIPRRPDGEGLSRKSKRGKAKRKAAESAAETPNDDDIEMADEQDGSTSGVVEHEDPTPLEQPEQDPTEISFVISKINSLSYGSSNFIVFTAVGISAFFYFQIHADGNCSALRLVDLVYPVVDFNICQSSAGPSILISVDHNVKGTHSTATDSVTTDGRWVYLLAWNGAELEVQPDSPLCNGLNTTARVDATEDTLTKLELYVSLSNLPKSREELVEDSGGAVDSDSLGVSAASERTTPITDPFATQREHTIKAKGRNRVRDKLLQNQQSGYGLSLPTSKNADESPASRESSEPEQKRVKVDADAPV